MDIVLNERGGVMSRICRGAERLAIARAGGTADGPCVILSRCERQRAAANDRSLGEAVSAVRRHREDLLWMLLPPMKLLKRDQTD
jgi:hypothetical protein